MVSEVNNEVPLKINFDGNIDQQLEELQLYAISKGWNERQLYAATLLALPRHSRETLKPPTGVDITITDYSQMLLILNNNVKSYASRLKSKEAYFDEFSRASIKLNESVLDFYQRILHLFRAARPNATVDDAEFFIKPKIYECVPKQTRAYLKLVDSADIFQLIEKTQSFLNNTQPLDITDRHADELASISARTTVNNTKSLSNYTKYGCTKCGGTKHTATTCRGTAICNKLYHRIAKLEVENDVLYHNSRRGKLLVLPKELQIPIIRKIHEEDTIHGGQRNTEERIRRNFFWLTLTDDVKAFVGNCLICKQNKYGMNEKKQPLTPIRCNGPATDWHADFIGPFPESSSGNKYILIFVDRFTKWLEAAALPNMSALPTTKELLNLVVTRHGIPKSIHTDCGTQFESELFNATCRRLGISHTSSTPYHPEGNGLAERYVKSLKEKIRIMCNSKSLQWDDALPLCLFTLRNTVSASTAYTPAMLTYGRNLSSITDTFLQPLENKYSQKYETYAIELQNSMRKMMRMTHSNIRKAQRKQKSGYDRKTIAKEKTPNLILTKSQSGKSALSKRFLGPFKILSKNGTTMTYDDNGNVRKTHQNNTLPYMDPDARVKKRSCRISKAPKWLNDYYI